MRVSFACLGSRTAAVQLYNSQKIVFKTSSPCNNPAWYMPAVGPTLLHGVFLLVLNSRIEIHQAIIFYSVLDIIFCITWFQS